MPVCEDALNQDLGAPHSFKLVLAYTVNGFT